MLERSAQQQQYGAEASRVSSFAPEMVTPPAPRVDSPITASSSESYAQATQVAEQYAEQRAHIVDL